MMNRQHLPSDSEETIIRLSRTEPLPGQPPGYWPLAMPWVAETIAAPLHRRLAATWQFDRSGLDHLRAAREGGPFIVSFFHESILQVVYTLRDLHPVAVTSPSWEGEIISRFIRGLGIENARGSSGHRPTAAIRESVRLLRCDRSLLWALDGPIGPRRMIQPGVFKIASLTGRPILPMHGVGRRSVYMPSWDRQEVPLPFTRVAVGFGAPVFLPPKLVRDDIHDATRRLLGRMRSLERRLLARLEGGEGELDAVHR